MQKNIFHQTRIRDVWMRVRRWWTWFVADSLEFLGIMFLFSLPYCSTYTSVDSWRFLLLCCGYIVGDTFGLFLIAFLISLLRPQWLRCSVRGILIFLAGIVCIGEVFFIWRYGAMPDTSIMEVVIATNPGEALEFFQAYACNASVAIGLLVGIAVTWGIWRFLHQIRKNIWVARAAALCLIGTFFCSIVLVMRHPEVPMRTKLLKWPQQYFSIGYAVNETWRAAEDLSAYEKILHGHTDEDIVLTRNEDDLPYVVFVLGESTSRNHMSLYGYPLETTPHLDARKQSGELDVFTDVVSPHSHTMPVLENLFTFYRYGMSGPWYEQHNLFDVLNVAGVHTAWLSNQESSGIYGNAGRVYASKCTTSHFTMMKDSASDIRPKYDEALLPILDDALTTETAGSHFMVVHLMGTHSGYADRYPPKFEKFHAQDETEGLGTPAAKKTRATYDNAVLYTDFIVDEIIRRFEGKDAIVIYVSDHADEVMEDREYAGHDEVNGNGTHWMIEIPMVVWMSPSFRASHPDRVAAVRAAVDRPYMTDDMIHSLLDLMHIETSEYHPEYSIFHPSFDATRKRIYAGKEYRKE